MFTPTLNRNGVTVITVIVHDAGLDGLPGNADDGQFSRSFSVNVLSVNDPPSAVNDTFMIIPGQTMYDLDVLMNDEAANPDSDDPPFQILLAISPANGVAEVVNEGRMIRFTPTAGFSGSEQIRYTITDNRQIAEGVATVTLGGVDLTLETGSSDLRIDSLNGNVRVLRNGVVDTSIGVISAASVRSITVTGDENANVVDLSGVTVQDFSYQGGVAVMINTADGDDSILGSGFGDTISGGLGNDTITGGDGDDSLRGESGNDVIFGGDGNDSLFGGAQVDYLQGGAGNDKVEGQGSTGDSVGGGPGDDTIDGGSGNDVLVDEGDADFVLTPTQMLGLGTDVIVDTERAILRGGSSNNRIDVSAFFVEGFSTTTVYGGDGDDTLIGSASNDVLRGDNGDD